MKRKILHKRWRSKETHMGFQVAPMIDIVFVILLFFMVAAGNARKETALKAELPGDGREEQAAVELPDEIEITLDEAGAIHLNGEPMDTADGSKGLPLLTQEIRSLKKAAGSKFNDIAILLRPDERVKYQRIVDVMDVLAAEKITKLMFESSSTEY